MRPPSTINLTPRDRDLIRLGAFGQSDKAISAELQISPHSVREYFTRLRAKLGNFDRFMLPGIALLLGVVSLSEIKAEARQFLKQQGFRGNRRKEDTQTDRILRSLRQGPLTSEEIAEACVLPRKHVAAYLSDLEARGEVRIFGVRKKRQRHGPQQEKIYEVVR